MATECELYAARIAKEMFGDEHTLKDAQRFTRKLRSLVDKDTTGDNVDVKYERAAGLIKEDWAERSAASDKAAALQSYRFLAIQNRLRSASENGKSYIKSMRDYMDELGISNANHLNMLIGGQKGSISGLYEMLHNEDLVKVMQNPNYEVEIAQMVAGEKEIDKSDAGKTARIIKKFDDDVLNKILNEKGIYVSKLDGRLARTIHDDKSIFSATRSDFVDAAKKAFADKTFKVGPYLRDRKKDRWVSFLMDHLNHNDSFPGLETNEVRKELEKDFDEREGRMLGTELDTGKPSTPSRMKDRIGGKERTYHFNGAESWVKYQKEFGAGGYYDAKMAELQRLSKQLAFIDHFGPNGEWCFHMINKEIQNLGGLKTTKDRKLWDEINDIYKFAHGDVRGSLNYKSYKITNSLKISRIILNHGTMAMRIAGGDMVAGMTTLKNSTGENWFKRSELAARYAKNLISPKDRKLAAKTLTNSSKMFTSSMFNRFDIQHSSQMEKGLMGTLGRMAGLKFKWMGVQAHHEAFSAAGTEMFSSYLANAAKKYEELDEGTQAHLRMYDLGSPEWKLWKQLHKSIDGQKYLTGDLFQNASKEQISEYLNDKGMGKDKIESSRVKFWKNELQRRGTTLALDYENFLVPARTYGARALDQSRLSQLNPVVGSLMQLVMQYKNYGLSVIPRLIKPMFETGKGTGFIANNMVQMGLMTLGFGAVTDSAIKWLQNKPQPSLNIDSSDPEKRKRAYENIADYLLPMFGIWGDSMVGLAKNPRNEMLSQMGMASKAPIALADFMKKTYKTMTNHNQHEANRQTTMQAYSQIGKNNIGHALGNPITIYAWRHFLAQQFGEGVNPGGYNRAVNNSSKINF